MNFKSKNPGNKANIRKTTFGSGSSSGPNPLIAASLSLCMLLGPLVSGEPQMRALAADEAGAEAPPPQELPSGGDTSASPTNSVSTDSNITPGSTAGSTTDAAGSNADSTTGDTANTGSLEPPAETKSKKRSTSRSSSSRSKKSKDEKPVEQPSVKEGENSSSGDLPVQGGSDDKPADNSASESQPGDSTSTERPTSKKSAKEKPVKTEKTSKKSKKSKKDADTASGTTTDETAGDVKPSPAVETVPEVKPPTGEDEPATETKQTKGSESQSDADATADADEPIERPLIKKPKKVSDDTGSDTDEIAPPKKLKRASSLVEADELLLKNKFEAAEDAYRSLIPQDDTGDAYAGLAVALAKQMWPKKVIEAEKIMKKAREQFSDNPNILAAGGFVSYIHSKSVASPAKRDLYLDAAESLSKRAVKESPDTVIAQQTLGLVKLAQDDPEAAIPPLKKAARIAGDPYTNTLLAEALLKVDPHDEDAKALIDEALGEDRNFHPARVQKAIYLTNKGKHEEGFTELLSIPRDQRGSDWHRVQGDIYKAQGDGPSALASWKEANRLDPRNPEPYKNLAHYYSARGDGELAIAEMHNALEILPNDLRMRGELAELALRQDKLDIAETEYRTILSVKENDPQSLLGLSRVYFRKARKDGQYPTGWTELLDKVQRVVTEQSVAGQLVKNGAKNLTEKIQLSEAEKALSDNPPRFRHARQLFSQVITNHREEPYELLSLGDQAYNDGDLRSAEEAFGYAKEINEVAPRAEQGISKIVNQRNEAKRHTELGNATWKLPEIAIDHYRQALLADPQHPDAYYGLYKLYYRLKKDDSKAIDYANNFLEASDDSDPLRKEVEDDLFKLKKRDRRDNSK